MKKNTKLMLGGFAGFCVIALITVLVLAVGVIGMSNQEIDLRTVIEAKQVDNQSEYDNMWKTISQSAEVGEQEAKALRDIIVGNSQVRGGLDGNGAPGAINIAALREAVPSITSIQTLNNLQNIVVGKRENWTQRQKELVDIHRQHTALLRRFPSGFILSTIFGREEIDITIVTSGRTQQSFETGMDDDISLF
jgi:Tfp pilus assembly protein PilV